MFTNMQQQKACTLRTVTTRGVKQAAACDIDLRGITILGFRPTVMGDSMLKLRRLVGCLNFNKELPIPSDEILILL